MTIAASDPLSGQVALLAEAQAIGKLATQAGGRVVLLSIPVGTPASLCERVQPKGGTHPDKLRKEDTALLPAILGSRNDLGLAEALFSDVRWRS